jgi:hypothetical protein
MTTRPIRNGVINLKILAIAVVILGYSVIKSTLTYAIAYADGEDPIPQYIGQVNSTNLIAVASDVVTLYGPRQTGYFSPFIDANCHLGTTVYPKNNVEMSTDYVKGLFEAMGYSPASITMEEVPGGNGHNVYVTKVGSTYPNVYIEFGAHIDTIGGTPGGNDNASGVTAVVELARVLKDYPNRYSMRFALWVAEEYAEPRGAFYGSTYHLQQALARGEIINAGLNFESVGWPDPEDPTGQMNEITYNNAESERIADLFNQVRMDYGIAIGFRKLQGTSSSDEISYWNQGKTAVGSWGGFSTYRPNYHECDDTVSNINFTNVLRIAQQNLAVGLKLDAEILGATPTPAFTPTPTTPGSISIGETNILSTDDYGNGNLLLAQQVNLPQNATLQSLSFYVTIPAGRLRLGIYNDSGGKPQTLKAQTAEFTPVIGWNTQAVLSPIYLTAGTYWLAYLPESNNLHFRAALNGSGCYYSYTFGALPATFSSSPQCGSFHWSFYATLLMGATPTNTPTSTATYTPLPTATNTPTATYTPLQTATNTPTATYTPLQTATNTPTATYTPLQTATNTPTATYTPLQTATNTPTATATTTSTSTSTPVPEVIFADGFESGNLSAWSSSRTGGGDLSASTAAALVGSYGMQAVINDNTSIYVTDERPSTESRYRARFYFDPNSITMTSGNAHYIFYGYSGTSTVVLRVEFRYYAGSYQLRAALVNDSIYWTTSIWFTISDAAHSIELDWGAATAAGANDGYSTFWIDGVQQASLTGVDNDTRRIDRIQLGAVSGIDSKTRGTYYFDAFESRRSSYIGP